MQIVNKKGEKLYLVVRTSSKEFNKPFITLKTWEDAIKMLKDDTIELDNEDWYRKLISCTICEIEDTTHSKNAHAKMLLNHRGWGGDFYEEINIEPAYDFYY